MVEIEKEEIRILAKPETFTSPIVIPNNLIPENVHSFILIKLKLFKRK